MCVIMYNMYCTIQSIHTYHSKAQPTEKQTPPQKRFCNLCLYVLYSYSTINNAYSTVFFPFLSLQGDGKPPMYVCMYASDLFFLLT